MSKSLQIATDLRLPVDAATQTFAFIARKGAGKTYAAGKLVELLIDAGVQVAILDTVGNWYGLRLAADGKSPGLDVPVLGGLRGDIPLDATGGALIADTVIETGRSVILDASQFSLADRKRFATSLGERLWQRKKAERHPAPLHLVIEESQLIVPQDVRGDVAKMVGIYEEIIRLGRNYGIGVSMITQRPQSVNKEVLNQTEFLCVGQINGSQERDALRKWITHQGMDVNLVDELPGLPIGTFYAWSPQWLNVLQRIKILPKWTYDSTATPKVGDKRVQRDLKPLDLDDLQQRLKQTIDAAKANDPRELQREIAKLKKQLAERPTGREVVEVAVLKNGQLEAASKLMGDLSSIGRQLVEVSNTLSQTISAATSTRVRAPQNSTADRTARPAKPFPSPTPARDQTFTADETLTGSQRKLLQALAWWREMGHDVVSRVQAAVICGWKVTSSNIRDRLSELSSRGLVHYPKPGAIQLTDAGAAAAPAADMRDDLISSLRSILTSPQLRIFDALWEAPGPLSRSDIATRLGWSPDSSNIRDRCSELSSLEVVHYPSRGLVALQDWILSEVRT